MVEDFYRSGSITLTLTYGSNQDTGPSVKEQVEQETPPFQKAIEAAHTMLVLHVNAGFSCDPYSRVWVRLSPFTAPTRACRPARGRPLYNRATIVSESPLVSLGVWGKRIQGGVVRSGGFWVSAIGCGSV